MTLNDFLARVRTGEVGLEIHQPLNVNNPTSGPIEVRITVRDASKSDELLEALRQHQEMIYFLLACNSVNVCMAPEEHRGSYPHEGYIPVCDACAAIRAAALFTAPAIPPPDMKTVHFRQQ